MVCNVLFDMKPRDETVGLFLKTEGLFLKIFSGIADSRPTPMGLIILFWAGTETDSKVVRGAEPLAEHPHVPAAEK